jgi:hypothetical protein
MDHDNHMNEDQKIIQNVLWELGDYYSRLGGSRCPVGMYDSHIPTYIICKLLNIDVAEYTSTSFVISAEHIADKIDEKLSHVSSSGVELNDILRGFYKYQTSKLKMTEVSFGWSKLGVSIGFNA